MDKVADSDSADAGSIPVRSAKNIKWAVKKLHKIPYFFMEFFYSPFY